MEEDIKNLKEIVDLCEKEIKNTDDNTTAILDIADLKSLKNILNELDRLQKENKRLEEESMEKDLKIIGAEEYTKASMGEIIEHYYTANEDCIPKQVIRDKIEELKEEKYVSQSDDYDYIYNKGRHEVLKELLGE